MIITERDQPAWMVVDLSAIKHNLEELRRRLPAGRQVIAALKADAYGHGCVRVAQLLEQCGVDLLAVGSIGDAAAIRAGGVRTAILMLHPLVRDAVAEVRRLGLMPTIDDMQVARDFALAAGEQPALVFVKVDCGFGRFGIALEEAAAFIREIAAVPGLSLMGLYTHIPFSDSTGQSWATQRLAAFRALLTQLADEGIRPPVSQALASSGVFRLPLGEETTVAVGHLLYGLDPMAAGETQPGSLPFRPALTAIRTRLEHRGERRPGKEAAAYLKHVRGPLGVIPIGIHHAYRPVDAEAFVLIDGKEARVLRPCLENTIIDLADVPDATAGAEVTLLGASGSKSIGIGDLSRWHGTSVLTVLAGLARTLPRRYNPASP